MIERVIRDGRRVGLHLDKDKQERIKDINTRISDLQIQFQKNMNDNKTCLYFTESELRGVSEEFVKGEDVNDFMAVINKGNRTILQQSRGIHMQKCSPCMTRSRYDRCWEYI